MDQSTLSHPSNAWYKEPWPWLLISVPAVAVVGGLITLYLALVYNDPLVVDNYYKEGLAINRVLARDNLSLQRDYRASVVLSTDRTMVRIQLTGAQLPDALRIHFIHPTRSGLDQIVTAQQTLPGFYEGRLRLANAARWDVEMEDAARSWRLTGDWYPSDDQFTLEAQRK